MAAAREIYSRRQAVAAMVGVLLDPEEEIVPPIRDALGETALATLLRLRPTAAGEPYVRPSPLFTTADFDTEHEREPALASSHGTIRVSYFFFAFGYPTSTLKPKNAKSAALLAAFAQGAELVSDLTSGVGRTGTPRPNGLAITATRDRVDYRKGWKLAPLERRDK